MRARIVLHPPSNDKKRAYCEHADYVWPVRPYLVRNQDIVTQGVDGLIAVPMTAVETLRSGTWATVRYARKLQRAIWLVLPDGKVVVDAGRQP